MILSEMKAALEAAEPDWKVHVEVDGERKYCCGLISWRGVYAEASLDWSDDDLDMTVEQLLSRVSGVLDLNQPLQGYKGGDFFMDGDTPVWADPYGKYNGRIITRVRDDVARTLRFETYQIPGEYRR